MEVPQLFLEGTVAGLLDRVFPVGDEERREMADRFDLRDNPDLPDIFAVFLAVCEEWRDWRCELVVSMDRDPVVLDAPVRDLLSEGAGAPLLSLRLEQRYRPLEYAVRHGFWPDRSELLEWLRSLALLYFLDKHEVRLEVQPSRPSVPALVRALDALRSLELVAPEPSGDSEGAPAVEGADPAYAITAGGRSFIARLLAETESYIDLYDHFQDVLAHPDGEAVEFGTGRGVDLRVQAYLTDGLDPIRTVFLLRLYDGTLDSRLMDWQGALETDELFEGLLEPMVNRYGLAAAEAERMVEHGDVWLEERQEQQRRTASDRELLRRAGGPTSK